MVFSELVELFNRYNRHNRSERTAEFYAGQLKKLLPAFGTRDAADMKPSDLLAFRATWHLILCVQRLFRWATQEQGLLPVNPVLNLRRPRLGCRRRVLQRQEVARVLRAASPDFRRFLLAAWESAARPGELRELLWETLRWPGGAAGLQTALFGGKAYFELTEYKARARRLDQTELRVIPVSPRFGRLLWRLGGGKTKRGPVFFTASRKLWTRNSLRLRMRRLRLRAGVVAPRGKEHVVCYTLRHSSATRMAGAGLQTSVLQSLLGHTNLRTTQRYVHLHREAILSRCQAYWAKPKKTIQAKKYPATAPEPGENREVPPTS